MNRPTFRYRPTLTLLELRDGPAALSADVPWFENTAMKPDHAVLQEHGHDFVAVHGLDAERPAQIHLVDPIIVRFLGTHDQPDVTLPASVASNGSGLPAQAGSTWQGIGGELVGAPADANHSMGDSAERLTLPAGHHHPRPHRPIIVRVPVS